MPRAKYRTPPNRDPHPHLISPATRTALAALVATPDADGVPTVRPLGHTGNDCMTLHPTTLDSWGMFNTTDRGTPPVLRIYGADIASKLDHRTFIELDAERHKREDRCALHGDVEDHGTYSRHNPVTSVRLTGSPLTLSGYSPHLIQFSFALTEARFHTTMPDLAGTCPATDYCSHGDGLTHHFIDSLPPQQPVPAGFYTLAITTH